MLMIMVSRRTDAGSTLVWVGDSMPMGSTCASPLRFVTAASRLPLVRGRDERAARVPGRHALQRVVLPQRVRGPRFRQLDPAQVRMPVEDHAEEVEHLALEPV